MSHKTLFAAIAVVVLQGMLFSAEARSKSLTPAEQDQAIERAFEDVLDREPTDRELRRYRLRMEEDHWSERDVREDLEDRSDYDRHSERSIEDPDRIVRRAYEDILHREPDEKACATTAER